MTPSEIEAKGTRAKLFLESDVWKEANATYRAKIFEQLEALDSRDTDNLKHLKLLLTTHTAVRKHIETIMEDGAVAANSIQFTEKQSLIDKVRRTYG